MSRRHFTFSCEGAQLVATLDDAPGAVGLLIVSGGNEIRSGAWAGHAQLAARIAASGHPVLRYDRRGVGDSEGTNAGFRGGGPDLAAALTAFRHEAPHLRQIVAFGNCDGASTLALHGTALTLDGLVLANPWIIDADEAPDAMPSAAIRSRYLKKIANPKEWIRLFTGRVNIAKLAGGLRRAASRQIPASTLSAQMQARLAGFAGPVRILLARHDRTAQIFEAGWPADDARIARGDFRSHSFSEGPAREWLLQKLLEALKA